MNLPITVVDVLCHVAHVIKLEPPAQLLLLVGRLVRRLERLAVQARAGAQVLLCVGEQAVRARADEVRAADFWVGHGGLWGARGAGREELVAHELLWGDVSVGGRAGVDG